MVEGDSKGKDLYLVIVRETKSTRLSRERRIWDRCRMTSRRYLGVTCIGETIENLVFNASRDWKCSL